MLKIRKSESLEDTKKIAEEFLVFLVSLPKSNKACVVGLSGELGAGKTTFTQILASLLEIQESITSPTFVIEKIYALNEDIVKKYSFTHLIHIDAYRLESGKELEKLGWSEISSDPNNLIVIEWPEKVADILLSGMLRITFKHIDEKTREISW